MKRKLLTILWLLAILVPTKMWAEGTDSVLTTFSDYVYFIGSTDGWAKADQKLALTGEDGIYTGFVYCADPNSWGNEFKFQRTAGSWDNEINTGTFTGGITGGFEGGLENTSNIIATGGEGVYYVTMDLKNNTLNGVKINNMNLVGDYNGWLPSDSTQQMTWNATDYCYEYTGAQVTSVGWKFAANNSWDINLGGTSIDNLVQNGANITVVGDTIKLYPTRRTSNNIYCTVGNAAPVNGTTIYVKSDTAPHLYAFTASDDKVLNGEFPGNEMTTTTVINGETFWTTTIPEEGPFEINIIDANGMYRTHEIYVISDRFFTYDGASGYTDVTAQYGEPREIGITSLALPGDHNEWNRTALFDAVNPSTEYSTDLDLSNFTSDTGTFTFKLFANGGAWLGSTAVTISAPSYVNPTDDTQTWAGGRNITIDLNATTIRRFHLDAVWTGGSDMEHGWKLTVSETNADQPETYAVLSEGTASNGSGASHRAVTAKPMVLTFYYDTKKAERGGMDIGPFTISSDRAWEPNAASITAVVFDDSFANNTTLTSTAFWFYGFQSLTSITGFSNVKTNNVTDMQYMFHDCNELTSIDLSNFNTANVTNMSGLFYKCHSLPTIDLSSFNTAKVTNMSWMFFGCYDVTTIYVDSYWTTSAVTESEDMFMNCSKLIGGKGTTFTYDHTDASYAHIDGGTSNPGYFTYKNASVVPDTVETPTFEVDYYYSDDLRMMTETDGAEIYYTMNGRMLQENDTDFGDGYLYSYNNRGWKVTGDNSSYSLPYEGYNDSRCLKLESKKDDTFQSAQATYKFDRFLTKGDYYTIRFKARSESGNGQMQFYCYNDTVANSLSAMDTLTIGKDWADYEATVKIANDSTNQFVLNFGALADTYYIDNVLFGPVISDTTNQMRTRYVDPLRVERGVTIKAVAVKEGMMDSKPAVFDYFYDGWRYIPSVYDMGWMICKECTGDPNVPLDMVEKTKYQLEDMVAYLHSRAEQEHVDDTELMNYLSMMDAMTKELDNMRRGFTIDGVSYHAVDSTQVELIGLLAYPYHYANAITVAKEVHYNDIDFQVTSVAQGAFANTELGAIVWNPTVALKYEDVAVMNNPNLLVYVNEASLAPENIKNIVVNKVAKNIELVDATNGNFYCPEPFSVEAISYTREFRQETMIGVSRGWEGIALPFDVQMITHEKSGLISPFSRNDDNKHFWLRRLSSNGLVPADKIEANVPYIIAMPNSTEYAEEFNLPGRVTFSAANVTVPITETRTLALADSTIMMASTMQRLSRSSRYYALNVGEVRGQYVEGSVFERDYREIRPFEVYTIHNSSNPAPRFIPVNQYGNGETTGIENVRWQMPEGRGEQWFTIDGRRLQNKPTQRGVYILNGRKVVMK